MGGGGSEGGTQMQNTSQTSQTGPNPVIAPKLENLLGQSWDWMGQNMNAPAYYPGGTVADQSARTASALTSQWQRGAGGLGYGLDSSARTLAADTMNGKYLDLNSNPYWAKAQEAALVAPTQNLMETILPGVDSKFAGAGRTAGGAHFDTTMRGVRDFNTSATNAAAMAAGNEYARERGNQYAAANLLPQFQAMDYQNIDALLRAGGADDARAQLLKLDENAKHDYESRAQLDWYNNFAQTILGMYPGGQTWGSGTGTGTGSGGGGGGSDGAQLAGAGIAAAGTIAAAFL